MTTDLSIFKKVESAVSDDFTLDIAKKYDWKPSISDEAKLVQGKVLFEIDGLNQIGQRINEIMIPYVVKAIHLNIHESIKGCKSINQLLTGLGIPKGTASGYVKIANVCYDAFGNLFPRYTKFNYKSLQLLAQANVEDRNRALETLKDNEHPTAKEVDEAIKYVVVDEIAEMPQEEVHEDVPATDKDKQAESKETLQAESKSTKAGTTNTHYQLCELRKRIDTLTKDEIKKALDDIIALG